MLKRINLTGNPNLGVYISVNDEVAIVPFNLPTEMEPIFFLIVQKRNIKNILKDLIVMLSLLERFPKSTMQKFLKSGDEDTVKIVTSFWFPVTTALSG